VTGNLARELHLFEEVVCLRLLHLGRVLSLLGLRGREEVLTVRISRKKEWLRLPRHWDRYGEWRGHCVDVVLFLNVLVKVLLVNGWAAFFGIGVVAFLDMLEHLSKEIHGENDRLATILNVTRPGILWRVPLHKDFWFLKL